MKTSWLTFAAFTICSIALAEPVIHRVGIRENLEFLEPGRTERMDLYYPADPRPGEKFPGIVIIHGGGWIGGIRNAEREVNIGSNLARMGYVCISIDYRLATPENVKKYGKIFPVNIQDCKKAVQWLRKHAAELNLNPAKIGSIGGSAGGHLSALLALAGPEVGLEPESPYPGVDTSVQACVNFYGPMDFSGFREGVKVGGGRLRAMGVRPEENRKDWIRMSPIEQIDPKDPPVLQIHAKGDVTVPYRQAVIMKEALDKGGVYNELILLEGYGHVFNLQRWRGKPMPKFVRQRVFAFYDRFLKDLSPSQAAERFAALEDFEKKHPEAANYGVLSLMDVKLEKIDRSGMTVLAADGKRFVFETAFDVKFEKAVRLNSDRLKDGVPVFVTGDEGKDNSIVCRRIVFSRWNLGRVPGKYGLLRKTADGWALENGKVRRRLIISKQTALYEKIPAAADEVKPGLPVIGLRARDYGDSRKVFYILFSGLQPGRDHRNANF